MLKIKLILYIVFLPLIYCSITGQYRIHIETQGWQDTSLILGYYMSDKMYVADTTEIDHHGKAIFEADTLLPHGIYTAYYPDGKYFDFLLGADQNVKIKLDTTQFVTTQEISGSDETKAFSDYNKYMVQMQEQRKNLLDHYRPLIANKDTLKVAQDKLEALNKQVSKKWDEDYAKYKGSYYGTVIKSFIPVVFTPKDIPPMQRNPDSLIAMQKYYFEANHYFDNMDLTEPGLWRTSFHQKRIDHYLNKLLIPRPDSIIPYAVKLIEASKANKETFRLMSSAILNFAVKSDIMGMESLSVRVAKDYYLNGDAYWADSTLLAKLGELVAKEEHTLLGVTAPELIMEDWQEGYHSLHQINAEYTILIFFEPNCSHCKKIIPEIYTKIWNKYKKHSLAVYCVYTQTDKNEWAEFIQEKELFDWIHVWDPRNSTNFRYYYDVSVTPRIFLLDKDKKIIGKKIGVENLDLMLDRLYKYGKL